MDAQTVFALSSAPGKAGVSIVRVSGPMAHDSCAALCGMGALPPRQAVFAALRDAQGGLIDRALVLSFSAPASFTGENVVEYQLHGSPAVVSALLSALSAMQGHRMAAPGEFTRRAFENGKLDLTEAEAVADLINAETQEQRLQALSQMDGALSRLYEDWRARLIKTMAYIETVIDFPDEDIPDSAIRTVMPDLEKLIAEITVHLNDNRRGERLRDGIQIAILGAPNAGKSSLLNALVRRDVAIVSPLAGTTRDVIEAHLDLAGYPVILADTAGLRPDEVAGDDGHGAIEGEGIRRALDRADTADLRLLLFDGTADGPDRHTLALMDKEAVIVFTKADDPAFKPPFLIGRETLTLSSKTGAGMEDLLRALTKAVTARYADARETPSLTRARHRDALEDCLDCLRTALVAPLPELVAEDVRMAARALGRITGRVDVEDLLDVIFRDFCIGK